MQIKKILQNIRSRVKRLIGININTHSLRVVALSYVESHYQVDACVNVTSDVPISDDEASAILKKIFIEQHFVTKNIAIALSRSMVVFKEIKIEQDLADREIANFLQLNLAKYVGEPASNLTFDYKVVERSANSDRILLHLVAVREEYITKYIQILQSANLCPTIIDVNAYALERAVRRQFRDIVGLIAIINVDSDTRLIVIIDNQKIIYSHEDREDIAAMRTTASLITWIKVKLQFISSLSQQSLARIILAGEQATVSGLDQAISEHFKAPTTIINPFVGMKFSSTVIPELIEKTAPLMLISCGLALRVVDDGRY